MSEPKNEGEDRRAFLEKAAKTALTAPAAALLLSASNRGAMAAPYGGNNNGNEGGQPGEYPGGYPGGFQEWWNNWWNNFWEDFWNRWRGN